MRLVTKEQRLAARQCFIPKGPTVARIALKDGSAEAYLYSTPNGRLLAMGFCGSAGRPAFHHSYRNEESRRQSVAAFFASVQQTAAYRANRDAARKAEANALKVGDILNTSWGYDQTNVDFYVVTRASAARVWVRPIASEYEATGFMAGQCWPAMPIQMIGPETMHVARGKSCSIKGHHASLTEGRTHYTSSYA